MAVVRPDFTIARRFLDTAQHNPSLPALRCGELILSYHSAAAVVRRAAALLTAVPAEPAAPIAILGRLDAWTPLLLLAAFSSGRTACVLDSGLPAARLNELLADLAPALIVSTDSQHTELITGQTPFHYLPPEQLLTGPVPDIECREQLDTPALIQYSSGTTGRPKGIIRSQRALIDHTSIHYADHAPQPDDAIALLYHPAYGAATSDIFAALLSGALLQIIDPTALSPSQLATTLLDADLTHLHLHASLLQPISAALPADARFSRLRSLRPSDRTDGADLQGFAAFLPPDCTVHHTLSSIESGPIARFQQPAGSAWLPGPLPVGYPLPDIALRLLDEHGNPVAPGTIGRIETSGAGTALGYWRDPDRTAEAFFTTTDPSVRTFRSSDLACLLPSGELQLHGRADRRVKIRGHSVALDAVEQALIALPGVAAAAAVALPDRHGNLHLFAYVTPQPDTVCDPLRLAALLRRRREAALVPQRIIVLARLPQRPNGKIDYQALPPPGQARPDLAVPFVAPVTPLEQQIAAIWADVLDLDSVGLDDPFILLGGDSISALHLLHRLETVIGRNLPPNLLIAAETVRRQAALAAQPRAHTDAPPPPAAPPRSPRRIRFDRLRFRLTRFALLGLLASGLIRLRYRHEHRLLQQLADAYGYRQPHHELWRRSVLANLLINLPWYRGPNRQQNLARRSRREQLLADVLSPVCLDGFTELEHAYRSGHGIILVTMHGPAPSIRKLLLSSLLKCPPVPTISGTRANSSARRNGRGQAADSRGSAAYHGLAALQRGEIIAFAADSVSQYDQTYHVPFRRNMRPISSGFAEVALLSNAAIFPICQRCDEHGRVTVSIGTPFQRPDPALPHEQQVTALLLQYTDWLNSAIADDPAILHWRFLPRELAAATGRTAAAQQKSPR